MRAVVGSFATAAALLVVAFVVWPSSSDSAIISAAHAEPNDPPANPKGELYGQTPAEKATRQKLAKLGTFDFIETPLQDVVQLVEKDHGLRVWLDRRGLDEAGLGADTPVTLRAKNISLRACLRHALQPLDVIHMVREDGDLMITTGERIEERMQIKVYPVWDIVQQTIDDGQLLPDYDSLIELLTSTIEPNTWEDVGGPGSVAAVNTNSLLIISQTAWVHEKIRELLTMLRQVPRIDALPADQPLPSTPVQIETPGDAIVRRALAEKHDFDFSETPLEDVVERITEWYKIPVLLDQRAIDEAGLGSDSPATLHIKDVTLARALEQLLDPLDLTYEVVEGLLLITTRDRQEEDLSITVYPVGDLVGIKAGASGQAVADELENLGEAITSTVEPNTWVDVGGNGVIEPFASRGVLVCEQTQPVQKQVAALLTNMRRAPRVGGPGPSVNGAHRSRMVTQVYSIAVPAEQVKDLEEVVTRLVQPESWKEPNVYIKLMPGKLVVHHRNEVHRNISRLLKKLGLVVPGGFSGVGGGGGSGGSGGGGFF